MAFTTRALGCNHSGMRAGRSVRRLRWVIQRVVSRVPVSIKWMILGKSVASALREASRVSSRR
jgi:hypothetical protein